MFFKKVIPVVKCQKTLVDVIKEAELQPPVHQDLPTHTADGVLIVYKPICYFHLHDPTLVECYGQMFIHLDDRVFREERFHDEPKEDAHGKRLLRYGICRPCAEKRKLVPLDIDGEAYLS